MSRYMQMIYIDSKGQAAMTMVGAEFESDEATTEAFESVRHHDIGIDDAVFILDLHEDNDDIVDSIAVSAESFTEITGEKVLSEAEYHAIDRKYHAGGFATGIAA